MKSKKLIKKIKNGKEFNLVAKTLTIILLITMAYFFIVPVLGDGEEINIEDARMLVEKVGTECYCGNYCADDFGNQYDESLLDRMRTAIGHEAQLQSEYCGPEPSPSPSGSP